MKRIFYSILIVFMAFISCEKDDICIESTTPNLIIRLYEISGNDTITKNANAAYIWVMAKDTLPSYNNVSIDSIAIPLDPNTDFTTYIFENSTLKDTVIFNYSRNDIFVSRSCGFKTTYESLNIQKTSKNWINNISIENQTVENETAAHIHIYH